MTTKNLNSGTAFIEMPCKDHFNIFVKWGYEVTNLYASNSYKYDETLKVLIVDGIIFNKVENLVFSF